MIEINGIQMQPGIVGHALPNGKRANGLELLTPSSWAALQGLVGNRHPMIGTITAVSAPRSDELPTGARINLVTEGT